VIPPALLVFENLPLRAFGAPPPEGEEGTFRLPLGEDDREAVRSPQPYFASTTGSSMKLASAPAWNTRCVAFT
jgi:hypothetical protein